MKWDNENKARLYRLLKGKFTQICLDVMSPSKPWTLGCNFSNVKNSRDNGFFWTGELGQILQDWNLFLQSHGIIEVRRTRKSKRKTRPPRDHYAWRVMPAIISYQYDRPLKAHPIATNQKNVIVENPFFGDGDNPPKDLGLSIPKDVAEKFLLIGVP